MFENPGRKIKLWANAVFVIGLIGSIIGGIITMSVESGRYYGYNGGGTILTGLLLMVLGTIGSFLSALLLYAVGTVVESVENIDRRTDSIAQTSQMQSAEIAAIRKALETVDLLHTEHTSPHEPDSAASQHSLEPSAKDNPQPVSAKTEANPAVNDALPEKYVIISRDRPSVVCPVCQTTQLSNRRVCLSCGIAFLDQETLEKANKAQERQAEHEMDNSQKRVQVSRKTINLICPLCGERQPSNMERCRKCKALFVEQG